MLSSCYFEFDSFFSVLFCFLYFFSFFSLESSLLHCIVSLYHFRILQRSSICHDSSSAVRSFVHNILYIRNFLFQLNMIKYTLAALTIAEMLFSFNLLSDAFHFASLSLCICVCMCALVYVCMRFVGNKMLRSGLVVQQTLILIAYTEVLDTK